MFQPQGKSLGARWLITLDGPPLHNASITIVDGFIQSLTPGGRSSADEDLGEVVLIPKFVNAHTHLEFSDLSRPVGQPGIAITEWIPQVVAARQTASASPIAAVTEGIRQLQETGTIAIGEIATSPWFQELEFEEMLVTCFVERLGNQEDQIESRFAEAREWLDVKLDWCRIGISPHAPYSLHPDLFARLIDWAVADGLPLAMHIAESREELQWLADGAGPFREMLESLNALGVVPRERRPLDYLKSLARAPSALIVHGNYLADDELDFIARHKNLHVVYCPRTHQFFQHEPWPLKKMLERGINVALGTDSRASSPDLDMQAELRTIRDAHPQVAPETLLDMATLSGARALGVADQIGSLSPGKRAEFLCLPAASLDDAWTAVFGDSRDRRWE